MNFSKQREAIIQFLKTRKDHPTAETVYSELRKDYPNISLGTVYRNLNQLADNGFILRINTGDMHFDADTKHHQHFICKQCGAIDDIYINDSALFDQLSGPDSDSFVGKASDCSIFFNGICKKCLQTVE